MSERLVTADDVTVRFGTQADPFVAVDQVTLHLDRSERVGIVGESGSGKTTIARAIAGLQSIAGGELTYADSFEVERRFRPGVQMVFQDPYSSLNPRQSALSAVSEAVRVRRRVGRADSEKAAIDLLHSIGIGDALGRREPDLLSGGQRQRISVARALAADPQLLIADEPTSALDQSAQAQLLNLLRQIQVERQLSILFISHDLGAIRYFTERVYVMRLGKVVESGPTEQVFAHPRSEYTRLLIDSIPGRRADARRTQSATG